jgi:hypothetical protein
MSSFESDGDGSMNSGSASVLRFSPRVGVCAAILLLATACGSSAKSPAAAGTTPASPAAPATSAAPSVAAAACGTGTTPTVSGTGPSDTAGAATQIATNYQKFFDPATPPADKLGLLQNGTAFVPVLQGFASNPLAAKASVTVLTVAFTSPTAADVTFNLCESGAAVLPGSAGKSILDAGVWKIADATLCGLVKLNGGGAAVPGCA